MKRRNFLRCLPFYMGKMGEMEVEVHFPMPREMCLAGRAADSTESRVGRSSSIGNIIHIFWSPGQ